MIVRWGLPELPATLREVGIEQPLVIATQRWQSLGLPHADWWSQVPSDDIEVPHEVDGIVAVGGGSAIDLGKYASADSGKPVVHVPTTYSGAEWTTFYGIRTPDRRIFKMTRVRLQQLFLRLDGRGLTFKVGVGREARRGIRT